MIPEPEWWGWVDAWRIIQVDPRRLPVLHRWRMLNAQQAEALEIWRWLQASVG